MVVKISMNTRKNFPWCSPATVTASESGATLSELLITLALAAILLTISLSMYQRLLAWIRLNIATSELSQHWKATRYQAMGDGSQLSTLCIAELENEHIQYAQIHGDDCTQVAHWQFLTPGVGIDENRSTLRRVSGIAGNNGEIYRVTWADTRGGIGGTWGQLGRVTLVAPGTPDKKCLFLFNVDGSWNIREDSQCDLT
jgi:Tfp pilus assembly protein FimT